MALSSECKEHDWCWSTEDDMGCPVCYGIELGEQRIIKLLEERASELNEVKPITATAYGNWEGIRNAIALIKGENK